jgi:hypothetical protein
MSESAITEDKKMIKISLLKAALAVNIKTLS